MPRTKRLNKFFALTVNEAGGRSLYEVGTRKKNRRYRPYARKRVLKGQSSKSAGEELLPAPVLGIAKGLVFYNPKLGLDTGWISHSSSIAALFMDEGLALMVIDGYQDFRPCDERWMSDTEAVLKEIGDKNPWFTIVKDEKHALIKAA